MPAPRFDPDLTVVRGTFLRCHVAAQLVQTADVLAVEDIRRRVEPLLPQGDGEARRRLDSVLRLDHFFERHNRTLPPDAQVYFPLPVLLADGPGLDAPDLTSLLLRLDAAGDRRGVALTTRSGAGKTVAARKAFFDCVFPAPGGKRPPLADFLPCWLDLADLLDEGTALQQRRREYQQGDDVAALQRRTTDDRVVLESLRQASGCKTANLERDLERVRDWLRFGPKLLLFADLNAADAPTRAVVARALAHFQHQRGAAGHRVVVAYRTTQPNDATLRGPDFRDYTLETIPREQALAYLRNIRDFERAVSARLREQLPDHAGLLMPPHRDIDTEVAKLAELIDRYDRPAGRAEESVVCTPLLMHLMSQLESGAAGVRSLTDLYDRVVEQHLRFDEDHYGPTRIAALPQELCGETGRGRRKTAMTRVALMMHARRSNRLLVSEVSEAWECPATGAPGLIGASDGPWQWPDAPAFSWTVSPYCTEEFKPEKRDPLLQYGFLHRGGDTVRFLHDSFIDYFLGGLALARPHNPEARPWRQGLRPAWFPAVATRLHAAPDRYRNAALFLAGALNPVQLRELLLHLMPAEPKDGLPGVVGSLLRGRPLEADAVLDTLARTLRIPTVHLRPDTLLHQCHDDLQWPDRDADIPVFRPVAEELRRRMPRTWLCYRNRGRRRPELIFRGHNSPVISLAILQDGRIVSVDSDCVVWIWDLAVGEPHVLEDSSDVVRIATLNDGRLISAGRYGQLGVWDLSDYKPRVIEGVHIDLLALVVLKDGRVVTGTLYGSLKVWTLSDGKSVKFGNHGGLRALAALDDGRIVSGGDDGIVRVWDLASGNPQELPGHQGCVYALAPLKDGRFVSGGPDCVRVWNSVNGESEVLEDSCVGVQTLATVRADCVISGTADGEVIVWDLANGECQWLTGHQGSVEVVAGLDGSRVVSGGADGTVRVWDLAGTKAPAVQGHRGSVWALAALDEDRVVSGGEDGYLYLWKIDSNVLTPVGRNRGRIYAVGAFPDGRVISGTYDGRVRIWDEHGYSPQLLQGHRGSVRAVAVLGDQRVLSASDDGTVRMWDLAGGKTLVFEGHDGGVRAVIPLSDWGVASGGTDGAVRVWDLTGREIHALRGHRGIVTAVTWVRSNPGILSASEDGTVRCWTLYDNNPMVLTGHRGPIQALVTLADSCVVSGGQDGTVRVWDLHRRKAVSIIEAEDAVTALCSLKGSPRIAMGLANGRVLFVDVVEPPS